MSDQVREYPITSFGTASALKDSTEAAPRVNLTRNIRGRPLGAITGPPIYQRFLTLGNSTLMDTVYAALTYTPFGGSPRSLTRSTDKTVAIEVSSQGKHWLVFYALNAHKCRGMFYMGDDGTYSGTVNLVTGSPTMTVLAVGLDENARWHGSNYYEAWALGNGVDPNVVVQLARTALAPGKWRLAGSNQRPAAAILREVAPVNTANVQATWTIPGGAKFLLHANGDRDTGVSIIPGGGNATAETSDLITKIPTDFSPFAEHGLVVGDQLLMGGPYFTGTPAATTLGFPSETTPVFVIASGLTTTSFKVSLTSGGAAINVTSAGQISYYCASQVYVPGHNFAVNDVVNVAADFLFPLVAPDGIFPAFAAGTDYHVVTSRTDYIGLSLTMGGSPILVVGNGSGNCYVFPKTGAAGARKGPASLTFTANPTNFPGTQGDNIYVSIQYSGIGYTSAIASSVTGVGSVSDPIRYTIYTGPGFSSTQAIVDFVSADSNAIGVLTASASAADIGEDTGNWAFNDLTGGVDGTAIGGSTVGFSNKTCTVYLRYWDPGVNYLGYEGISSDISNTLIIGPLDSFSLDISIPLNPLAESGRFGFIRAYLQFGEDVSAQWNLIGEVANVKTGLPFQAFSTATATFDAATDYVSPKTSGIYVGAIVQYTTTGSMPSPLVAGTHYYVVAIGPSSNYKISAIKGGPPINITTAGTGTITQRTLDSVSTTMAPPAPSGLYTGMVVRLTTTGALPAGLTTGHDYYVTLVNADPAVPVYQLSLTLNGDPVLITGTGSGTHTVTPQTAQIIAGVSTPVGQVMMVDQNRPPPSPLSVISGGYVWHAGITATPDRLYPSKQATETELFPEGANNLAYELVHFPASESGQKVTALYSDDQNLYVHSPGGIVYFPPNTPAQKTYPRTFAGAATESAIGVWTQNRLNYLGADLNLYQQVQSAITPLQSDFLALDAAAYVRGFTDLNAFAAHPDRVFMFSDVPGQCLWFWVPGTDGTLLGFAYDRLQKGIVGPFDRPKVYALTSLEVGRPEYVFADEAGNLFVWNSAQQYDYEGDLPSSSSPTIHTTGSGATTPSEQGFGQVAFGGGELWRATTNTMETGYLDMRSPGRRKAILGALLTTIKGSRAQVTMTLTGKNGVQVSRAYGDVADKGVNDLHKVVFSFRDTAVKFRIDFITAQGQPCTFRNAVLQYRTGEPT